MKGLREGVARNQAFQIEAMRYSLRAAQFSFSRVVSTVKQIEKTPNIADFMSVFVLLADCWSVVDTIKRSREVLLHIRGLKRKTDWVQEYLKATDPIEHFRNVMQHIATHIPKLTDQSRPIMGAYAWISSNNPHLSHSVWFSGSTEQLTVVSLPVDTWTMQFGDDHVFSLDNREVSLLNAVKACEQFSKSFEDWLEAEKYLSDVDIGVSIGNFDISGLIGCAAP
jgi:hypothetical protein